MRIIVGLHVATLGATTLAAFAGGQTFDLSRFTIDSGGAMRSAGGSFELSGTIGQPDLGVMSSGTLTLTGGFWFANPPGDCNNDGYADLLEIAGFENCATGPSGQAATGYCRCFDLDRSGHVDLADFAAFQSAFGGGEADMIALRNMHSRIIHILSLGKNAVYPAVEINSRYGVSKIGFK